MRTIGFSNASTQPFLTAPIQILVPWIARLRNALGQKQTSASDKPATTGHPVVNPEVGSCKTAPRSGLRVVREFDSTVSPDCAGRMVISGRMADVCAELDRMALRGTAVH